MEKILKPLISVFDVLDVTYSVFTYLGATSFSRVRRSDGKMLYYKDKCDILKAIGISLLSLTGYIMLFFYSPYVILTSTRDNIIYKLAFFLVCAGGIASRLSAAIRANFFLKSLHLIDEVDGYLRKRRITVNCNKARFFIMLYMLIPVYSVPLLIGYFNADTTEEDDSFYEIVHLLLCFSLSYVSIAAQALLLIFVAVTVMDRFKHLITYLDKIGKLHHSKILEQELLVLSKLHFKLCQSWKLTVKSYGLSQVALLILAYLYSSVPLTFMGYILPKLKNDSLPAAVMLVIYLIYSIHKLQELLNTAEKFRSHLVDLTLKRNSEKNIHTVCKTFLLQVEHWNIDLVFCGVVSMDAKSFLEGMKALSTVWMFLVQLEST